MRVYRFMGADEAMRLCAYHIICQRNDWHGLGYDSTSKGFTFGIGTYHDAVEASRWLKGVVDMQYLLEADIDHDILHPCVGRYPDYRLADPMSKKREINEVYANAYSLEHCTSFTFFVCLGILSDTQKVDLLPMLPFKKCFELMAANSVARYQKLSSMGRSNNTKYVEEFDLTETDVLAEWLKSVCAKKEEADDKTREAFTK